ncbi:MAG: CSLREA domain-containing protein, partial [Gammaproteobacteria bacterium]|nr:CSLREA domain-containing protein [Gammaproteobacteria bacterium]
MTKIKRSLLFCFSFLFAAPVVALDFNVNSALDDVDINPGDGLCVTVTGSCTLRAAIQEANAGAGADIVHLLADTYVLTLGAKGEDLAAEGDLDVTDDLTITGAGNTLTVIDGNATDRILDVRSGADLTLQNLGLQNGLLSGSYGDNGAAVRVLNKGTLTVSAVQFLNNEAFSGGAVYCLGSGHLEITDALFDSNLSRSTDGSGGAGSGGALASIQQCSVSIMNSVFSNNTGRGYGGAIQMESGELLIVGSTFSNNSSITAPSNDGGAISIFHGNLTVIVDSSFTGNSAADGGAISSRSPIYIFNSSFTANTAISNIGGAFVMSDAYLNGVVVDGNIGGGGSLYQSKIYNSVFKNNTADPTRQITGGGLSGSNLEIKDSAFINNTAYSSTSYSAGGGLYLSNQALVENTTVSGNVSNNGGGIFLSSANGGNVYTLTHVTVTGNESKDISFAANLASSATGITANLANSIISAPVGGPNCVGLIATAGGNIASDATCGMDVQDSVADPLLAALDTTDYVHGFLAGSPAIDYGMTALCPVSDQRGLLRSDAACDTGAYEQGATAPATSV